MKNIENWYQSNKADREIVFKNFNEGVMGLGGSFSQIIQ